MKFLLDEIGRSVLLSNHNPVLKKEQIKINENQVKSVWLQCIILFVLYTTIAFFLKNVVKTTS